jgi:hypothetical protein
MKRAVIVFSLAAWLTACGPTAEPIIVDESVSKTPLATGPAAPVETEPAAASGFERDIAIPEESGGIVPEGEDIAYQHDPPASGPHYPAVLQYGLYEGEDVHAGYWVHSLKRGAIVILYKCDQPCPDLVRSLGDMLDVFPETKWGNRKIVIAPYSQMDVPLMAVAWNVQMPLDRFDPQALIDFYARHVDQGPEDLP